MLRLVDQVIVEFEDNDTITIPGEVVIGVYANDFSNIEILDPIGPVRQMNANYIYFELYKTMLNLRTDSNQPVRKHFDTDKDLRHMKIVYTTGATDIFLIPWDNYTIINELLWLEILSDRIRVTFESANYIETETP